jgi:transcriptional regulator GlxA family with amidase domain
VGPIDHTHKHEALLVRARALMQQRLSESDLTLCDIAATLFVSPRQLQRAFAHMDSPGFRYELTCLRIREAARLIHENPKRSVAATAKAVGYRQSSFFAKTFREQLGKPPGLWRRQCRDNLRMRAAAEDDLSALDVNALYISG